MSRDLFERTVQRTLEELWAREHDPAARKQALFELWSDCADDDAGQRARAMVIGWIRANLPEGSAGAYTPDDLDRLGFQPYDKPRTMREAPNASAPPGTR